MIIILLGVPGSGKGTQSKALVAKYHFEHLSTGDMFRSEISQETVLGKQAREYVNSGKLVPDSLVTQMVAHKVEGERKCLLDGFPRTIEQAHSLTSILGKQQSCLVILLDLSPVEAIKRLTSRRICSQCGEVFNVQSNRPRVEGMCDRCGGVLIQREDDSENTAKMRLRVFDDLTRPLVNYYEDAGILRKIDAARPAEMVANDISKIVDEMMGQ